MRSPVGTTDQCHDDQAFDLNARVIHFAKRAEKSLKGKRGFPIEFGRPSEQVTLGSVVMPSPDKISVRFRVDFSRSCSIGIGKIELLEAIARTGAISKAAREIGMSYRRAWVLIEDMKLSLDMAVVQSSAGGVHGGGAAVTQFGNELIARYRQLESEFQALARTQLGDLGAHAKSDVGGPTVSTVSTKRRLPTK
jgi:molybdate transport system regulatory protein